jgi:FKBP-type peptidyl-prolyl cis-trans isomerase FklB
MIKKFGMALALIAFGALFTGINKEQSAMAASAATYDLSPESNTKYLTDNATKPGVKVLPSGLQYRVIHSGKGKSVKNGGDVVTVNYKGWMVNGTVFDQTQPGQPASFPAGRLIKGWVEALSLMKEGDEWELTIPAGLAYGSKGAGGVIPPNQTLVFDMTLIAVEPRP